MIQIRHATPADLDELSRIEAASYPATEAASRDSIAKRLAVFPEYFWLLDDDGHIRAFINGMVTNAADLTDEMYDRAGLHDASGDWQMIFSVVTDPKYRGRGYAGRLLRQVIADAEHQNRQGVVLTCKEHMLGFYAKFGFQNEGLSRSAHGAATWYQMRIAFSRAER